MLNKTYNKIKNYVQNQDEISINEFILFNSKESSKRFGITI